MQLTPSEQNRAIQPDEQGKAIKITRKVRDAINAMVWEGLPRAKAAEKAGISDHGLYKALRSPPVKAYYLSECEVLRTSGRARRIHRLEQMVEQDDNKQAVVNAVRALELMGDDEGMAASRANSLPGLQIVVVQTGTPLTQPAPLTIENDEIST
jgi:hypothetical protein